MTILSVRPGPLNAFALRVRDNDTLKTIRERIAHKLSLASYSEDDLVLKYEWVGVRYTLEDDDDWDVMRERSENQAELTVYVSGSLIPLAPEYNSFLNGSDSRSVISGVESTSGASATTTTRYKYGAGSLNPSLTPTRPTIETIRSSSRNSKPLPNNAAHNDSASIVSKKTDATARSHKSNVTSATQQPEKPAHTIAFEQFHGQRGVRTFVGSIGPVENVRMMMKPGHRYCYMSREFAQQHDFIPNDASPGYYGYSGITNLGKWPIKVGEKTVSLLVMLVEDSYFPVILGRSFSEKRKLKMDPLDQTSVTLLDTGEVIPTDVVVVKDAEGNALTVS